MHIPALNAGESPPENFPQPIALRRFAPPLENCSLEDPPLNLTLTLTLALTPTLTLTLTLILTLILALTLTLTLTTPITEAKILREAIL